MAPGKNRTLPHPQGYVEVLDSPRIVREGDKTAYGYSYLDTGGTGELPLHSFVIVDRLTRAGSIKPFATIVLGKVGEDTAYLKEISNPVGPFGVELALQSLRVYVARLHAQHRVQLACEKCLKRPTRDPLQIYNYHLYYFGKLYRFCYSYAKQLTAVKH